MPVGRDGEAARSLTSTVHVVDWRSTTVAGEHDKVLLVASGVPLPEAGPVPPTPPPAPPEPPEPEPPGPPEPGGRDDATIRTTPDRSDRTGLPCSRTSSRMRAEPSFVGACQISAKPPRFTGALVTDRQRLPTRCCNATRPPTAAVTGPEIRTGAPAPTAAGSNGGRDAGIADTTNRPTCAR